MEQYSRQPLVYLHHSLATEGTEHPPSLGGNGRMSFADMVRMALVLENERKSRR